MEAFRDWWEHLPWMWVYMLLLPVFCGMALMAIIEDWVRYRDENDK
jgi:hypothetical protein